jgi:pimeloyl-ACP methyl ester carboxylesterase
VTMDRRTMMAGGLMAGVAATAAPVAAQARNARKQPFVLVHGTWLGGWIWADVADRLRAAGHRVYTPTLTGVGERAHLARPDVGLETHITDITSVIDCEELDRVILLGHSFSGVSATGAADRRRDRIAHICFFDAVIPAGDRLSGVETNPDGSDTPYFAKRRAGFIDGYMMDFWKDYPLEMLVSEEWAAVREKLRRRITPHPAKAWTDRLRLENGGWEGMSRSCIRLTGQKFAPSSEKMWGPSRSAGWTNIDLPHERMAMLTHPDVVASALLSLTS